jgi:glycopeptide antibiotics resistance protein
LRSAQRERNVAAGLLVAYLIILFYLTMRPLCSPPAFRLKPFPFVTTAKILRAGGWEVVHNIVGNLAAFVPLGFLVPVVRGGPGRRWSSPRIAALSGSLSLLIEVLQFCSRRRICDVDDVILNTAGGVVGYLAYRVYRRACGRDPAGVHRGPGEAETTGRGERYPFSRRPRSPAKAPE